jgi:hypothetical protein
MKDMSSTEAKTHFGGLCTLMLRIMHPPEKPVTCHRSPP